MSVGSRKQPSGVLGGGQSDVLLHTYHSGLLEFCHICGQVFTAALKLLVPQVLRGLCAAAKSCALCCAGGFLTRVPAAALALLRGGGFTLAERAFMAASWVPKVRAPHAKDPLEQNSNINS